ncbi:MAG: hypothetical protein JW749_01795 [Sedimentisphaerales bacterium]|nr:hypothetical protein [Sedimentisphaerales bacterium]
MININTGEISVEGKEYNIGPLVSKDAFLQSDLGREAQEIITNEGWSTFKVGPHLVDKQIFLVSITFYKNLICELSLMYITPNEPRNWSDHTVQFEKERKIKHDEYLHSQFHKSPYKLSWGKVISVYDEKSSCSEIIIRYEKHSNSRE